MSLGKIVFFCKTEIIIQLSNLGLEIVKVGFSYGYAYVGKIE